MSLSGESSDWEEEWEPQQRAEPGKDDFQLTLAAARASTAMPEKYEEIFTYCDACGKACLQPSEFIPVREGGEQEWSACKACYEWWKGLAAPLSTSKWHRIKKAARGISTWTTASAKRTAKFKAFTTDGTNELQWSTWVARLDRKELPNSDELWDLIQNTLKQMEEGRFEKGKRMLDWCPLVLKQLVVRYVCRASCTKLPVKETEWFLVKTQEGNGHSFWHCPVCGERYFFAKNKAESKKQDTSVATSATTITHHHHPPPAPPSTTTTATITKRTHQPSPSPPARNTSHAAGRNCLCWTCWTGATSSR